MLAPVRVNMCATSCKVCKRFGGGGGGGIFGQLRQCANEFGRTFFPVDPFNIELMKRRRIHFRQKCNFGPTFMPPGTVRRMIVTMQATTSDRTSSIDFVTAQEHFSFNRKFYVSNFLYSVKWEVAADSRSNCFNFYLNTLSSNRNELPSQLRLGLSYPGYLERQEHSCTLRTASK